MKPALAQVLARWPEPVRVLRLKLRPYSLGHHLLICRTIGAAETAEPPPISSRWELMVCAFICSQTVEAAEAGLHSRWLGLFLRLWAWVTRKDTLDVEAGKFSRYVADAFEMPDVNRSTNGKRLWGPWENRLKVQLMGGLGLSESEVLNRPLALCLMDDASLREMSGDVDFWGDQDEALAAKVRELEEAAGIRGGAQ